MKTLYLVIIVLFIFSCNRPSTITPDDKIPVDLIKADFRQVTSAIEQQTPNPFYMCGKAAYDSIKIKIYKSLDKPLSPIQFYQKLSPLIALLEDEHFQLFIGTGTLKQLEADNPTLYFPFSVFVDGNKMYTNKNFSSDTLIRKGTEILTINNIPVKTIVEKVRNDANLAANHENYFERRLEDHFYRSLLMDVGLRNSFTVTFRNKTVKLKGVSAKVINQSNTEAADFSYHISEGSSKIGYLRLNTLLSDKKQQLDSTLLVFFKIMEQQKVANLIIDIRNNFGGSTKLVRAVFNYITTNKYRIDLGEEYFKNGKKVRDYDTSAVAPENVAHKFNGNAILLTNVKTYSSAHMMAVSFKSAGMGKVIGQVSSEPLFISGEVQELITANTKCQFYYPVSNFYLPGFKKGVVAYFVPDIEIHPAITDRISGKDEAMATAERMMK
nr:S41 family peptidase [uncultured Mucilaginibacter sp.]